MATEAQHFMQFEHNRAVADRLSASSDYDWAVVALFYSALHLVQAYFVRAGVTVESHRQRGREIRSLNELRSVFEHYATLRNESEQARYECRRYSNEEFQAIRRELFEVIVAHLSDLLEAR